MSARVSQFLGYVAAALFAGMGLVVLSGALTPSSCLMAAYNFLIAYLFVFRKDPQKQGQVWEFALGLLGTAVPFLAFRPHEMGQALTVRQGPGSGRSPVECVQPRQEHRHWPCGSRSNPARPIPVYPAPNVLVPDPILCWVLPGEPFAAQLCWLGRAVRYSVRQGNQGGADRQFIYGIQGKRALAVFPWGPLIPQKLYLKVETPQKTL